MEHFDFWVSSSSCSSSSRDEKVEPTTELLEENWFFSNLFHRKAAMVRSASWSGCQEVTEITEVDRSNQQASISTSKLLTPQQTSESKTQVLQKEPKLDSQNKDIHELQDEVHVQHNIVRSPSRPPSVGRKIATNGVEESTHGSRKLMRQASLNSSSPLPPQHVSKSMTPSSSIRRRTKREIKVYIESHDGQSSSKDTMNKTLSRRKTMSDLEIEELQGFMDLGFTFNKEDLDPSVVNIIPALRERSQEADNNWDEEKVRTPYLSEAWVLQRSSAPMIPSWLEKKSAGEDMKEQLKYWARAVASNVR